MGGLFPFYTYILCAFSGMSVMYKSLLFCSLALLLVSCGVDSKHFKIEGRFLHMNQGELYVYGGEGSVDGIDTIKVEGGRFAYEMPCEHASTLMLVFPNFSEQPIFAEPGKSVDIDGDASHLKKLKVKGTDDNELMTKFRQQIANASPPETKRYARQFCEDHPESAVSVYLVRRYFVAAVEPDYRQAVTLIRMMEPRQPANGQLVHMKQLLKALGSTGVGAALPAFTAYDMNGRLVSSADLSAGLVVVCTWASWSYESTDMLRQIHQLQRSSQGRLKVVSISLDAGKQDCRPTLKNDSISWPNICDGMMFDGKTVQHLGLKAVPDNLLLRNGRIIARSLSPQELQQKIKQNL